MSIKIIFATLCVGLAPAFAQAFRLSPMVLNFSPQGTKSTQVLLLENQGTEKVPIQMEAFARTVDKKGEEVRTKTEDFVIYPEQVVLLPGEKRNVRITFSGEVKNGDEQAYRIIASQLPVKFSEKTAKTGQNVNLNFLLQYVASAYVVPPGVRAQVKVKEVKKINAKSISLHLVNEGNAHRVLLAKNLSIYSGDKLLFQMNTVKELENINLLPKTEKTITIAVPKEVPAENLRAELSLMETGD
jgi:fimbrial chaperone protein